MKIFINGKNMQKQRNYTIAQQRVESGDLNGI